MAALMGMSASNAYHQNSNQWKKLKDYCMISYFYSICLNISNNLYPATFSFLDDYQSAFKTCLKISCWI